MPFEIEYCDHEPERVTVIQDGAFATVRMRKDIEKDTRDMPDGGSCEFWRARTLGFRIMGSPTAEEIEADFDNIAEQQIAAERTMSERVLANEQATAENSAAILELADLMAGGDE